MEKLEGKERETRGGVGVKGQRKGKRKEGGFENFYCHFYILRGGAENWRDREVMGHSGSIFFLVQDQVNDLPSCLVGIVLWLAPLVLKWFSAGLFWRCRGWSWVGSATFPAPNQATAPLLCSTPNPSTVGRSTGSQLRSCKKRFVTHLKDWFNPFLMSVNGNVSLFLQSPKWQKVFLFYWGRMEWSDVCKVGDWSEF